MKNFFVALISLLVLSSYAYSQGCIAIRNLTGFGQFSLPDYNSEPVKWLVNVNTRYSQFDNVYEGSEEVPTDAADQPYSHTYIFDFAITRNYEKGWSVTIDVPFMAASRETYQEHGGPNGDRVKHTTNSWGIGDIRVTAYKWLFDVTEPHRGNVQVGLGLKLPTGDYNYQDYFYKTAGKVLAPVNPTLQLGDGGTGISTEVNAFYTLTSKASLYGNMFYLISPRDQNGTSTTTGNTPTNNQIEATQNITSVPDAFSMRGGINYTLSQTVIWGGIRFEGSPVEDFIGSSNGQRRAGYSVSIEPGVNYQFKKSTIYMFVPIPIYRTINQTVADKRFAELEGNPAFHSRGGMPNYLIFLGALFKI